MKIYRALILNILQLTLEINDIEEDGSIKITLKKIIFTDDHTRILLSIDQRRYGDISF